MIKLSDSLQVYAATKSLPLPDDKIDITASGTIIAYQGYAGTDVLETIDYSNGGQDPKDKTPFTYYVAKDRKKMQLLAFMEETQWWSANLTSQSYAVDYEERHPKTYGNKIGVLIKTDDNTPLQEIPGITGSFEHFTNTGIILTSLFSDTESFTASGYSLYGLNTTRLWEKAPSDCPEGFIWVPWNPEFDTQWFCVAQYEMTYSDANAPNTTAGGTDWNTVSYVPWKQIVSQAWKYPIADITQQEAIDACKTLGTDYHLMTNNQWMTLARNIEANKKNWTGWNIGQGYIYNGVSNDLTLGCNALGWNTEPRTYATKTGPGIDTNCNARRIHTLSNGKVIWDFSWNLWEQVNKANSEQEYLHNAWQTSFTGTSNPTAWDNDGLYTLSDMQKQASLKYLGRAVWLWNIYYSAGVPNNIFLRWGKADVWIYTWLYALSLVDTTISRFRHNGFRCIKE